MGKPERETKAERFVRIAEARVNKILMMLRSLGKMVHQTGNYEYTPDQVEQIFDAIISEAGKTKKLFADVMRKPKRFSLVEPKGHEPIYENRRHIVMELPDGSKLAAVPSDDEAQPVMRIYWTHLVNGQEVDDLVCSAGHTPFGAMVMAYRSQQEGPVYLKPYEQAEGESSVRREFFGMEVPEDEE